MLSVDDYWTVGVSQQDATVGSRGFWALGGGGLIKAGVGTVGVVDRAVGSALPGTLAGNVALNTPLSATSVAMTALEPSIDEAVPASECSC